MSVCVFEMYVCACIFFTHTLSLSHTHTHTHTRTHTHKHDIYSSVSTHVKNVVDQLPSFVPSSPYNCLFLHTHSHTYSANISEQK